MGTFTLPIRARPGETEAMRKPRIKNDGEGFYHVTSRCVDRTFRFDDADKDRIVAQMKRMGAFCGVEIGTFAVMSNHFHILLHVLPRGEVSDDELVSRVAARYGRDKGEAFRESWAAYRRAGNEAALKRLAEERAALLRRMGDLSAYMKELKQWISRSYNKVHGRKGTLWEDRFWSCLLEDKSETLTAVAAYIDRNAVRAGIVERPEDYRWCGYAEAHAGRVAAQRTLAALFHRSEKMAWAETEERYGWLLHHIVSSAAHARGGERIPAFTRALALGSRGFILETYARFPKVFTAKKRPARPYVTDGRMDEEAICASHPPREAAIG